MDEARIIAWIEGELSPEEARQVAAAVAADPELAAQAERHRRVKARFAKAFGGLIDEAARMPRTRSAAVVPIGTARARREAAAAPPPAAPAAKRDWRMTGAVAASLLIGIVVGLQVRPMPGVTDEPHALVLGGTVAEALDRAPSGSPGPVRIALSFRDEGGAWCRSFAGEHIAGIACRDGRIWQLRYAAPGGADAGLSKAIDAIIAGAPANAAQERTAIATAWK